MKKIHEDFLRACLGKEGVDSLNKSIARRYKDHGPERLDETYLALMIVPRALLSWVTQICKKMEVGDVLEVEIPMAQGTSLLLNKKGLDEYSGYVHKDGEKIHEFGGITVPDLAGHLMTVLELYDDKEYKDDYKESPPVINQLVPLIDTMVAERMKLAPAPVINVTVNNAREEKTVSMPPTMPVMKEEPNSHSFKAGYHMAMGNFYRSIQKKDLAYDHDTELDKCVQELGKFSSINKDEFDAGAESAIDKIKKGEWGDEERDECEDTDHRDDRYADERKELIDVQQRREETDDNIEEEKEKAETSPQVSTSPKAPTPPKMPKSPSTPESAKAPEPPEAPKPPMPPKAGLSKKEYKDKLKGGLADKKKPKDFDPKALKEGIKIEMEHTDDKDLAREIAMDHLTEDPNYYKKLKTIEKKEQLTKQQMDAICPDCGGKEFTNGKFVGCICMGDFRMAELNIIRKGEGYEIVFGKGWDKEGIEILLDVLKRRNDE